MFRPVWRIGYPAHKLPCFFAGRKHGGCICRGSISKIAVILREPKRPKNPVALPSALTHLWRSPLNSTGSFDSFHSPRMTCDEGFKFSHHPRICRVAFLAGKWDGLPTMASVTSDSLVVFQIGEHEFAVSVAVVGQVLRAVEIEPVPEAPRGVRGVINLRGKIVPVFDLWERFGQPAREVRLGDHLIIAHTHWRTVALLVDAVVGVVGRRETRVTPAAEILPDLECISGVMKLDGGLVLVHDIEGFLSIEDHNALHLALNLEP